VAAATNYIYIYIQGDPPSTGSYAGTVVGPGVEDNTVDGRRDRFPYGGTIRLVDDRYSYVLIRLNT